MANNPPTMSVLKHKGAGNVQVYPLLPTQLLGSQDGSDVGTGGPSLAAFDNPSVGSFPNNRNIEFLNDRYCVVMGAAFGNQGVYKKNQGGAGAWGRVQSGSFTIHESHTTGLHVLHPAGVPTLAMLVIDSVHEWRVARTTDGTTGAAWGLSGPTLIETNSARPDSLGQSLVFRDSIVWAHGFFDGGAGGGVVTIYDLQLGSLTRGLALGPGAASSIGLHVHQNVLFILTWNTGGGGRLQLFKFQAGTFPIVFDFNSGSPAFGHNSSGITHYYSHNAMFTDLATGDLIVIGNGRPTGGADGTTFYRVQNATTTPVVTVIGATVLGAAEGANKYLTGGGAANGNRRWAINVDTDTDPLNPRTFLTTWLAGGSTETWEWKGVASEMEAVALLAGVSDDFAFPYNTVGGGHRSPSIAAVELGDAAVNQLEVIGGTQFPFRGYGSAPPGVLTFRGGDDETSPFVVVPIVAGSLVVGTGMFVGLEAYYHLDGTGTDSSGKGLTLTLTGSPTFGTGILGSGFDAPGSNGVYLNVAGFLPTLQLGLTDGSQFTPFAVQAWVNPDSIVGDRSIVELGDAVNDGWKMELIGSAVNFVLHGRFFFGMGAIPSGSFSHLVCTSDGVTLRGYIDGVETASAVQTLNGLSSGDPLRIGNRLENDRPFDGIIDEVAIWQRGLSAAEVLSLYNAGAGKLLTDPTSLPTTPTISGNTIINMTPDNGATLYSIVLDVDAAGVDIDAGDIGLIIPDLV